MSLPALERFKVWSLFRPAPSEGFARFPEGGLHQLVDHTAEAKQEPRTWAKQFLANHVLQGHHDA